ncbi:hypothetical protein ACFXDE_09820 [Kitasatospora sp. NPDC059408]|uniref:hypothetical protein n=1 Tax=Kitasatospora sp. NPDC059408 TaxID=3346823 RepID=UPI0036C872C4
MESVGRGPNGRQCGQVQMEGAAIEAGYDVGAALRDLLVSAQRAGGRAWCGRT